MSVMADLREMAENRERHKAQEPLRDLRDRLIRGRDILVQCRDAQKAPSPERSRLSGKVEGVNLAISYLEEALR